MQVLFDTKWSFFMWQTSPYWPHITCLLDQTCPHWLHITCLFYRRNLAISMWNRLSFRTMNSSLVGYRVCLSSDVSPAVMVIVQTVTDLTLLDTFWSSAASITLGTSEFFIHVFNCTCIYKGMQMKSKIPHTWTWMEAACPPHFLCSCPSLFFRHLRVIRVSYRQESLIVSL